MTALARVQDHLESAVDELKEAVHQVPEERRGDLTFLRTNAKVFVRHLERFREELGDTDPAATA